MPESLLNKTLVFVVIALFIGVAVQPGISTNSAQEEKTNVEPKDYLFQTVIDIGNNPDVQKLLKQVDNELIDSDFDYKSIFHKLLLRKPNVLTSMLFTKPKLTTEYLNFLYNNGNEIINIIGEEKAIEIINSTKLTNRKIFNDVNSIIINDPELNAKITKLIELNTELKIDFPFIKYPVICVILAISLIPIIIAINICDILSIIFQKNPILEHILYTITNQLVTICIGILFLILFFFDCLNLFPDLL